MAINPETFFTDKISGDPPCAKDWLWTKVNEGLFAFLLFHQDLTNHPKNKQNPPAKISINNRIAIPAVKQCYEEVLQNFEMPFHLDS